MAMDILTGRLPIALAIAREQEAERHFKQMKGSFK